MDGSQESQCCEALGCRQWWRSCSQPHWAEAASRVSGAEQEHRHFPLSLNWGMFYPLGQLAYGCRHPLNENLIHSRMPHDSKGKCINENTNSEQKVVINVQCTCAASLIMLPGNRGRGAEPYQEPVSPFQVWAFAQGRQRAPLTALSSLLTPICRYTCMHTCILTFLLGLQNAILNK